MNKKATRAHSLRQDILLGFLLLMCVPFIVLGYAVYRLDLSSFKSVIEKTLTEKTGRSITLTGDLNWSIAIDHGISLGVSKVSIGNPKWASRPRMAQIGSAKLHVELWPLFKKKLNIVAFDLADVDMQLEKNKQGKANWNFKSFTTTPSKKTSNAIATKEQPKETPLVSVNIKKISIKNSRIGFLSNKGTVKIITVPLLTLRTGPQYTRIHYNGTISGLKAEMDLAGASFNKIQSPKWPFNVSFTLDKLKFDGKGYLKDNVKQIIFTPYLLAAKKSKLYGDLTITLGGKRPNLRGTIKSAGIDPDDFIFPIKSPVKKAPIDPIAQHEQSLKTNGHMFSRKNFNLNALKSVDVSFNVLIDKMAVGLTTIDDFRSKIRLYNGVLTASSTRGEIANSTARAALKLNAAINKPELSIVLKANNMDMSHFVKLGEIESFIEGRADIDVQLNTQGRNMHELAAHSNGHVNVEMDTGMISKSVLSSITGSIVDLFVPGVNLIDAGINCMAARYTLSQGLLKTKGLLIDTAATTIYGTGYANLADERINMSLTTKPKALSIGSMIPSVQVRGSLLSPNYIMDTDDTLNKVTGLLNGNKMITNVPTIVKVPKGQNACVETLKNPSATPKIMTTEPILAPGGGLKIKNTVNKLFEKFGKGLF